MKRVIFVIPFLFFLACTEKKQIPHAVIELGEKITKMENQLKEQDTKLKTALDHGLQIELTNERELLNSRLEREKERMKVMWPTWEQERQAAAASGGGGGGHH